MVAARKAFNAWVSASAYNRSQILYRMAEMVEGRKTQFIEELVLQGVNRKEALTSINKKLAEFINKFSDKELKGLNEGLNNMKV